MVRCARRRYRHSPHYEILLLESAPSSTNTGRSAHVPTRQAGSQVAGGASKWTDCAPKLGHQLCLETDWGSRDRPDPTTLAACASHSSPRLQAGRVEHSVGMHGAIALKPVDRPRARGLDAVWGRRPVPRWRMGAPLTQLSRASEEHGRYTACVVACGRGGGRGGQASGDNVGHRRHTRFPAPLRLPGARAPQAVAGHAR